MKKILLFGKNGQVGWELQSVLAPLGNVVALDRSQLNLEDSNAIRRIVREVAPSVIVNAAAYTAVDKAESEPELAQAVNATAPGIMGEAAKRAHALLIHYSTDYVFDGLRAAPYVEADAPNPCNVYGRTKLAGERAIESSGCAHLILRTSWVYGARGSNFVLTMLRLARQKKSMAIVDDQIGAPTLARLLAVSTAELIGSATGQTADSGVYHLCAADYASRFELAKAIIAIAKDITGVESGWADLGPTTTANYPLPAQRPLYAALSTEKIKRHFGIGMPAWNSQLRQFMEALMADAMWRQQAGF